MGNRWSDSVAAVVARLANDVPDREVVWSGLHHAGWGLARFRCVAV